jgi:hypothetical protein
MPDDRDVMCTIPGVRGVSTIAKAKELNKYCERHRSVYTGWGRDGAICRPCVNELRALYTIRMWEEIIARLLPLLTADEREFIEDVVEEFTETDRAWYISDLICAGAFMAGVDPKAFVTEYKQDTLLMPPI